MRISQYWQANKSVWLQIKLSTLVLLLLLQIAAWYPFLSDTYQQVIRHERQKANAQQLSRDRQVYTAALRSVQFGEAPWLSHHVVKSAETNLIQWHAKGTASLTQWRTILETVETRFALILRSASWRHLNNGHWRGELMFDVTFPTQNRPYHDWLPVRFNKTRFLPQDWQLKSVMRRQGTLSALVMYKQQAYWVQQGSWLPEVGLAVREVSFDGVSFYAEEGPDLILTRKPVGGVHDSVQH
ncbi:hypothetical protein [Marinomonas algarum]|uniref:Uncharacterized protein n=1 Tax=Marinomonas algarum TaxID=2883105 RepID=A0A9X1IQU4_9GAMM|nr:hypothetical protein [Marinomonas algarum]MCB5162308.1 hypothetical protein [Marinomonas algarum]